VLAVGVLVGVPLLIGALALGPTVPGISLLALGAFAIFSANAVELVMVQEMLPDNRSAAVGVTYFVKTSGSIVATIAVGALGELIGLREALLVGCGLAALSVPLIVALPETRRHRPPEPHVST
jgi:MFS family permease